MRRFTAAELAYLKSERKKSPPTLWKVLAKRLSWPSAYLLAKAARYHDLPQQRYRKILMSDKELECLLFSGASITALARWLCVGVTTIKKHKKRLRQQLTRCNHAESE